MSFKRLRKAIILILLVLAMMLVGNATYAFELQNNEFTKKYQEWLELPEEERKGTIAPLPFNIRKENKGFLLKTKNLLKSIALPSSYDLRDDIDIEVKNQMQTGLCWGFSATSSVETNLALNGENYNFSERHLEYNTANNLTGKENLDALDRFVGNGGTAATAFTYYSRGSGPILEESMPFENNEKIINTYEVPKNIAVKKVDNMLYFPNIYKYKNNEGNLVYEDANEIEYTESDVNLIRNSIKEHIKNYGGITVSVFSNPDFYNSDTNAYYCNDASTYTDHAVTLIGWDDEFSKDNFYEPAENDGAYIVLNSWGSSFGENGVYYISYDDCWIESSVRGIIGVSDIKYDNLYQYDISEMWSHINSKYAANVFTSKANEKLTEIMLGSLTEQTCNIYIGIDGECNINNTEKVKKIASNVSLKPGYNTIDIEDTIQLSKDSKFAIIVELVDDEWYGIGVETEVRGFGNAKSNAGESFASNDGENWEDLYETFSNVNFSIKAYTQTDTKSVEVTSIEGKAIENIGGKIYLGVQTSYEEDGNKIEIKILKDNDDVTNDFNITGTTILGKGAYVTIECPTTIQSGEYQVELKLSNFDKITKKFIVLAEDDETELPSISIKKLPLKTIYVKGEALDLSGGKIVYNEIDGTTEEIDLTTGAPGLAIVGFNIDTIGKQTINIKYKGLEKKLCDIYVKENLMDLSRVSMKVGQEFNLQDYALEKDLTLENTTFTIENEDIAKIDGKSILGLVPGRTELVISSADNFSKKIPVIIRDTEEGTKDNPYLISTAEELNDLRDDKNGYYKLVNDIDASSLGDWEPVGSQSDSFKGFLDGNGYKISGLNVNIKSEGWILAGLFGYTEDAEIKNLGITNSKIYAENTVFEGDGGTVGAFVGLARNTIITNVYNEADVEGKFINNVGGIVGMIADSQIIKSYNTGSVTLNSGVPFFSPTGGIAGGGGGTQTMITECYNAGNVTNKVHIAGGIIGDASGGKIENCYNTGHVEGISSVGGIAAEVYYYNFLSIKRVYNTGELLIKDSEDAITKNIGGIIGTIEQGELEECYYSNENLNPIGNTLENEESVSLTKAEYKTLDELKTGILFENSEEIWSYENNKLPTLKNVKVKSYLETKDNIYSITEINSVNYITEINVIGKDNGIQIKDFINNFEVFGAKICNSEGNEITDNTEIIKTGMKVITKDNKEYIMIIDGDINGDGIADATDAAKLLWYSLGKISITENYYLLQTDINKDNTVDATDAAKMLWFNLGKISNLGWK